METSTQKNVSPEFDAWENYQERGLYAQLQMTVFSSYLCVEKQTVWGTMDKWERILFMVPLWEVKLFIQTGTIQNIYISNGKLTVYTETNQWFRQFPFFSLCWLLSDSILTE